MFRYHGRRDMLRYGVLVVLLSCAILGGCDSKELTRSKAKQIIESSDLYKLGDQKVVITREEAITLVNHGYAAWQGFGLYKLVLTETGKRYFKSASGETMMVDNPFTAPFIVVPKTPLRPTVVEITGITDDQDNSKKVEYRWKWDTSDLPEEVKSLIPSLTQIHHEQTTFKLYDDD